MKFNIIILALLGISFYSCKDNLLEETNETEIIDFQPNEEEPSNDILEQYPNGVITFKLDDFEVETVEHASVVSNSKETLIISEFVDPNTGNSSKILIGAKGFSKGDFKGNVLGFGTGTTGYDLADITFTNYGEVGMLVSGTFSVTSESQGNTATVSGEFNAIRRN